MATKELKKNREQCSAGATIAVAILEQRQRKFSAGYLQNCDLQFPNLTYARPRLLFTLVFSYKKSMHDMKRGGGELTSKKSREKEGKSEFTRKHKSTPVKKSAKKFGFNFHCSLLVPFLTL